MTSPEKPTIARANNRMDGFLRDLEPFFHKALVIYVDVGAHDGDTFREVFGSGLNINRAHLIEPNPRSFAALSAAVAESGAGAKAVCYNMAAGAAAGTVRLHDADTMSRVLTGTEAGLPAAAQGAVFEVEATTLDALAEAGTLEHVSLLKIDVEGFEMQVLEGARGLLAAQAIDVIYIEAGADPESRQQTYYREIEDHLRGHDYRLFRIYEQMHEWMEDSPLLRRVNLAFMSRKFADRHPFRLINELQSLRTGLSRQRREAAQQLRAAETEISRLKAARFEEIAALTGLLETARKTALEQDRAQEALADTLAAAQRETQQAQARIAQLEKDLAHQQDATLQAEETGRETEQRAAARARGAEKRAGDLETELRKARIEAGGLRAYAGEIEKKYAAILQSRSWRSLEPVRGVSRALTGRRRPTAFVPRFAAGEGHVPDTPVPATADTTTPSGQPVADLIAKLWGGFSGPAQEDLRALADSAPAPKGDRVQAAWNLARWEAASGNWDLALGYLGTIAHLDKTFFRSHRCRAMVIEAHLRTGDPAKAIDYAEQALARGADGTFLCGLCNGLMARDGAAKSAPARLDALNRAFTAAGLVPIRLRDPGRGLVFGNLDATAPAREAGPKISVLVPVWNAAAFLETAIGSLLAQSWRNLEILAVDDASTDDSGAILERMAAADPRLRVFRNPENSAPIPPATARWPRLPARSSPSMTATTGPIRRCSRPRPRRSSPGTG